MFDGGTDGLISDVSEDDNSKASICSVFRPKLRPRRLVVGVPVTCVFPT